MKHILEFLEIQSFCILANFERKTREILILSRLFLLFHGKFYDECCFLEIPILQMAPKFNIFIEICLNNI